MKYEIKRWGNSAAIQLPRRILAQAGLELASPVNIEVEDGKIIIQALQERTRKINFPFTEAQLLQGMSAYTAHADELALPEGRETGE